jgi:hypothetical protein
MLGAMLYVFYTCALMVGAYVLKHITTSIPDLFICCNENPSKEAIAVGHKEGVVSP